MAIARSFVAAASVALALALGSGLGSGCTHVTTRVPGVLDLRSDGSAATVDTKAPAGPASRSSFDAIMMGDGVTGAGDVRVEDRKYWICNLVPVFNESATEEIAAGLGGGALRNVRIGEQFTVVDWAIGVCAGAIIPFAGLVLPPRDFHFWGTRIVARPDAAAPPALSPAPEAY